MEQHLNNTPFLSRNAENSEIYVVCLDSYHNGNVYGVWIDATKPVEGILKQIAIMQLEGYHGIAEMLSEGYYPDRDTYAIHCRKGFYNLKIYVNTDIEDIQAYALFIAKYGELGAKLITHFGENLGKAKKLINDRYLGDYKSQADYAVQFFNKHYLDAIPKDIRFCIDYDCLRNNIFTQIVFL
jgi:antirestriction protein